MAHAECPSGGVYHETHYYCPDCSWVHPEAEQRDRDELIRKVERRRRDPAFMARLQQIVEENRDVLDALKERGG